MPNTTYKDIIKNKFILAPSQISTLSIKNKNVHYVRDFLNRELKNSDKGEEVGSVNYISKSIKYFVRAKALQKEYFLPVITNESAVPIRPQVFKNMNLREGDILLSKDSNIGEVIILDKDYPNHTLSGAIYKLPVGKNKYYLFAFLKHEYFLNQLDLLVPKGSTIRHAKTLFLDCKIPFPTQKNKDEIISHIEILTQAIINKEKEIRRKSHNIFDEIEDELLKNQTNKRFNYNFPNIKRLKELNRINAGFFSEYFLKNEFLIKNYINGFNNIKDLGFNISRGQNLQVSCIGKSIHSKVYKKGFYTVIKPKHLSVYGTSFSQEYLGNAKSLKALKKGDIIFGAEGFEKGRSIVIMEDREETITNIHGITINHKTGDMKLSIFVKCFLDYLRKIKLIDIYAVGGNGGSLAMKYWDIIPFPKFPEKKQSDIVALYSNPSKNMANFGCSGFLEEDQKWNQKVGIIELDSSVKQLKKRLNKILNQIINDEEINLKKA